MRVQSASAPAPKLGGWILLLGAALLAFGFGAAVVYVSGTDADIVTVVALVVALFATIQSTIIGVRAARQGTWAKDGFGAYLTVLLGFIGWMLAIAAFTFL